jgi:hypothetical protein
MEPTRADITRQPAFGAAFSFYGDSGDSCIYLSIYLYLLRPHCWFIQRKDPCHEQMG